MKNRTLPFPFLALLLLGAGCSPASSPSTLLPPKQAQAWLAAHPQAQLVDVRTAEEYGQGHLAGSKLVPVQELEGRAGEIDAARPVLLYCHSGRRSHAAFTALKAKGYKALQEIEGGIQAWEAAGLPIEKGK